MELAKMTSKGQITVPVSIRRMLGLETGDRVFFYLKDNRVVIAKESLESMEDARIAAAENYIYSLEEIKEVVIPIAKKHKVGSVRLFGSYARNEATKNSEINLVIDLGKIHSLLDLCGFENDLSEAFHKKIDVVTDGCPNTDLLNRIKPEEIMLYKKSQK